MLCAAVFGESPAQPLFSWSLLWSGSWEESVSTPAKGSLNNRGEIKLNFLQPGLALRGEVLDRHATNFDLEPPWIEPEKGVTNFTGGFYHKPTGSRVLYGVLDEWGLAARIRNPWIRSPAYAENHKPHMADLKTAASSTKEDEAYLYLSTPFLKLSQNLDLRGFVSAQTRVTELSPALSGGLDMAFKNKSGLLLDLFYTGMTLPAAASSSWFSSPPPLPEREFNLYAAGVLYYSPLFSVSSDWAFSETFAWGDDIYGNLGVCVTPQLTRDSKSRPLSVSFAFDGGGERLVYRDSAGHGAGFRGAGKIEWKGKRNALFRVNSVLRAPELGGDFNRSSSGIYYRFPAVNGGNFPVRLTRVSLSADRNAVNTEKISDKFSGYIGTAVVLPKAAKNSLLGINLSGSVTGLSSSADTPSPYPAPEESWVFDNAGFACEFIWSPNKFQIKSKFGYTLYEKKDDNWDISFSASVRFKNGRLSLKASSPDFPEKWGWTVSWRLEKPDKR